MNMFAPRPGAVVLAAGALVTIAAIPACAGDGLTATSDYAADASYAGDAGFDIRPGFEKDYRNARKDEADARQDLAKANGKADRARASLIEGERMMSQASTDLAAQQAAYAAFSARTGTATSAKAVESEIRTLSDIAEKWSEADATYADGAKMVKSARKDLGKAEEARVKAEAKLAKAEMEIRAATITNEAIGAPTQLTAGGGDVTNADATNDGLTTETVDASLMEIIED